MKVVKIVAILIGVYVLIVVVFELRIGVLQPDLGNTLVITTSDEDGNARDRVLTRLKSDGLIYVSAHHWPRSWYRRAVANPEVEVSVDGEKKAYRAGGGHGRRVRPRRGQVSSTAGGSHPAGFRTKAHPAPGSSLGIRLEAVQTTTA